VILISNQGLLLQRFHDLHEYIHLIGEHINQIYTRIEAIETNIENITNEHKRLIETNKNDLDAMKAIMVTKSEINNLMQDLHTSISGILPTLPLSNTE
jgi:archaellum component FlaC